MGARVPLISIIVNVYNGERYLGECLRSILALRGGYTLQVIVIDDASTDRTESIARDFDDARISYIRHSNNLGAAAAVNTAFEQVRGELVGRIDYDDRYRPEFLETLVPVLLENESAGLVCAAVEMIDRDGKQAGVISPVQPYRLAGMQDRFLDLLKQNFIAAPTILARSEAWRRALPVPRDMNFCDWYMSLSIAEACPVAVVDSVVADYRIHPLNMHSTMVLDRSGERITWQVLNRFFCGARAVEVAPYKKAVYAKHYAEWGDKYFGALMNRDALRCYLAAIRNQPSLSLRGIFQHRLIGLVFGRSLYERLKALIRRQRPV